MPISTTKARARIRLTDKGRAVVVAMAERTVMMEDSGPISAGPVITVMAMAAAAPKDRKMAATTHDPIIAVQTTQTTKTGRGTGAMVSGEGTRRAGAIGETGRSTSREGQEGTSRQESGTI